MSKFKSAQIDFTKLMYSNDENEYMVAIIELSNELLHNILLLSKGNGTDEELSQKKAILTALLIRSAKLFDSFMYLATQNHTVGATFLCRGIVDCIADMTYLIKKNEDELFDDFVKLSLYTECEKYNKTMKNIEEREDIWPIEQRILTGIEKDINHSGYNIQDVKAFPPIGKNKWKKIRSEDKIKEFGYEDMYLFFQKTGNNYIHNNWSILLNHHLNYKDGKYSPKYRESYVKPQMFFMLQRMLCEGIQHYIAYMFYSEEQRVYLSDIFSHTLTNIMEVDRLHEAFLIRRKNKTKTR